MNLHHRFLNISLLAFATTLIVILTLLLPQSSHGVSVQSTRLPHPFQFTENKGQWDSAVVYKCEVQRDGFTWFLERDGVTLVTSLIDSSKMIDASRGGLPCPPIDPFSSRGGPPCPPPSGNDVAAAGAYGIRPDHESFPLKSHALKFKFVASGGGAGLRACERRGEPQSARRRQSHSPLSAQDAPTNLGASAPTGRMRFAPTEKYSTQEDVGINSDLRKYTCAKWIDAQGELSWHNNYFLGNDSSKWAPDCRNFTRVVYHDVWDSIDVEWYESKGHLEFDFVFHPGADPKQIKMVCEGLDAPVVGGGRTLLSVDSIISVTNRSRTGVSDLLLSNELSLMTSLGELQMSIPGAYQSTANGTRGNAVTAQFRLVSENVFAIDLPNGYDASQTLRIDPLVYSTYLGGSGNDNVSGICEGGVDEVIVTGQTSSNNYPTTVGAIQGGLMSTYWDCIITKLNYNTSTLIYSTYLSMGVWTQGIGITSDGSNGAIICGACYNTITHVDVMYARINSTGNHLIYSGTLIGGSDDYGYAVCGDGNGGATLTGQATNGFPHTSGAYDTLFGGSNAFVTRINNDGVIVYSTALTMSTCYGIASDNNGGVFVTGGAGRNFPTTHDAFDTTYNGGWDAFVTHLNSTGSALLYSTFLGGSGNEKASGADCDASGNVFVTGYTSSGNFPTTIGCFDSSYNGGQNDCFITKINLMGSQLEYSTYFGSSGGDWGQAICLDDSGGCTVTGYTDSTDFPTSTGAFDRTYHGRGDCFITHLNRNGSMISYSTYLGGSINDMGYGIMKSGSDRVIVAGITNSPEFPRTTGAFDTVYHDSYDCFITQLRLTPDSNEAVIENHLIPTGVSLSHNYPNPFNSSTTLSYSLPHASMVELKLFDLTGREILTLVNQRQNAGSYRIHFDGSHLTSGTYFLRMKAGQFSQTRKIVLLK